jgi:nucleotide-binding universal stress UspA family protein
MRILCATDLRFRSDAAIDRAGQLADQLGAELSLMHVVAPGESHRALEQTLQWADSYLQSRVRPPLWRSGGLPDVRVHAGVPSKVILDTADRSAIGLLVLGPHRPRSLCEAIDGTIAQKALLKKRYPVLVVRNAASRSYQRVVLALDLSAASACAIRAAESLVLTGHTDSTVVHAHPPPLRGLLDCTAAGADAMAHHEHRWHRAAEQSVRALLRRESGAPARYDIHLQQRPPAAGILRAMRSLRPDLLVMGTRGGGRLRRALVGSVASRVLQDSDCDVLIVPQGSMRLAGSRQLQRPTVRPRGPACRTGPRA